MTFNSDADISKNRTRRPGRSAAIAGGGVGLLAIVALIAGPLLGVDLSGLVGLGQQGGGSPESGSAVLTECETGDDANTQDDCRMAGAQVLLDGYWERHVEGYTPPQLYIVGHEWGHHIQNITGIMDAYPNNGTGPYSNSVRTELQADCYAGAWLAAAAEETDENGVRYLEKPTEAQIEDALNTAFTVGDDHIQEQSGFNNPESWTHGSSVQRQGWFASGFQNGLGSCDTFAVDGSEL